MDRSEEREQARLIRWASKREVRAAAPMLAYLFHVPNGGRRDGFTGAQMTALGVKRGVPDLLLPARAGAFTGLAIEMKSAAGRLAPEQSAWLEHLAGQAWRCELCRSAEDAARVLADYLGVDLPGL